MGLNLGLSVREFSCEVIFEFKVRKVKTDYLSKISNQYWD
jgi:hypothetical protein